jgi:hypothetical protein
MELFPIPPLLEIFSALGHLDGLLVLIRKQHGDSCPDVLKVSFANQMRSLRELCSRLKMTDSLDTLEHIADQLAKTNSLAAVESEIKHARRAIKAEIRHWNFVAIIGDRAQYSEKEMLFGVEVYHMFESARLDIREAGNCIAVGLATSAVFHLMRVAEHGLRKVARDFRITLRDKGKPQPIEHATWDKTITAIKNKIAAIRALPQGGRRQAKLSYFSDAADHCLFMKDIWRNNVSHTHSPYTVAEAVAAFERVRDFMRFVAEGIE